MLLCNLDDMNNITSWLWEVKREVKREVGWEVKREVILRGVVLLECKRWWR